MSDLVAVTDISARMSLTPSQAQLAATLITRASAAIERECRRSFAKSEHLRWLETDAGSRIYLPSPPCEVLAIYSRRSGILRVQYSGTAYVGFVRPSRSMSEDWEPPSVTGIWLVDSGTTSLTYAAYPTLGQLATAISAVSGWSATVDAEWAAWPSRYLDIARPLTVPKTTGCSIGAGVDSVEVLEIGETAGVVWICSGSRLMTLYNGGYAAIPEVVKELCVVSVLGMLQSSNREKTASANVRRAKLGGVSGMEIEFHEPAQASAFGRYLAEVRKMYGVSNVF